MNVPHEFISQPHWQHGFDMVGPINPEIASVYASVFSFLSARLG